MRRGKLGRRVLTVAALALAGCAHDWERVGPHPALAAERSLEVRGPEGWVRWSVDPEALAFTRDGPGVQLLVFEAYELEHAFPALERPAAASLLPSELSALALGELKTLAGVMAIEALASEPATLAGRAGFRLHVRSTDARGLRSDNLLFGAVSEERYLLVWYRAPTLHYFERDRAAVERAVASFRHHP